MCWCILVVAKVTVPYTAVKDNQLSLEQGQLIHVLEQDTSGWWKGQLHVSDPSINYYRVQYFVMIKICWMRGCEVFTDKI